MSSVRTAGVINMLVVSLLGFGLLFAALNWLALFETWRTRRFQSGVPLLGGACLFGGMLFIPKARAYSWAAILADPGTLLMLPAIPRLAMELWQTSRINLVREYVGESGKRMVHLRLFREGVCILREQWQRPRGECGLISASQLGTWYRDGDRLSLHIAGETAVFEALPDILPERLRQSIGFPSYEADAERSLSDISLIRRGAA